MQGQKVHEYSVEVGPNGLPVARLGRVHNLITFGTAGERNVHYLDGNWVDDGGNPIDPDTVSQDYKDKAAALPFTPQHESAPDVFINCEFCDWADASRQYARHLSDRHIRPNGQLPNRVADPPFDPAQAAFAPAPKPRLRPEQLPPGKYALDDEGFVILNSNGSPRKVAGRPKKEVADEATA